MHRILPLCLCLAAPALSGPTRADPLSDFERAAAAVASGQILPLAAIMADVQARYPGRVIEVELDDDDGALVYEVELVTEDGRLIEIEIDAATGAIIDVEEDDAD